MRYAAGAATETLTENHSIMTTLRHTILAAMALAALAARAQTVAIPAVTSTPFTSQQSGGTSSNPNYRIPSIVKGKQGDLVAFADKRYAGGDIGSGRIDIVMRQSRDFGKNWGEETTVLAGDVSKSGFAKAHGDAATVYDEYADRILLVAASGSVGIGSSTVTYSNSKASVTNAIRIARAYGNRDGQGWKWTDNEEGTIATSGWVTKTRTTPYCTDITQTIYDIFASQTSGTKPSGLFFSSGRMCQSRMWRVGQYYRVYAALCVFENKASAGAVVIYSDDLGQTWHALGGPNARPATSYGNEAKVEELPNGDVLLSSRDEKQSNCGRIYNVFHYTDQVTATGQWNQATTAQIGSRSCNGEVLMVKARDTQTNEEVDVLLQSTPTGGNRNNVSIYYKVLEHLTDYEDVKTNFASHYAANQWTQYQVSNTSSAYSTMTLGQNDNIAFLYEENSKGSGYDIVFKLLPLTTITGGRYAVEEVRYLDRRVGRIVLLRAKVKNTDDNTTSTFYLRNNNLTLQGVPESDLTASGSTPAKQQIDYSYYWVVGKTAKDYPGNTNADGDYYFASMNGDGYIGKGKGIDFSQEVTYNDDGTVATATYKESVPICTEDKDKLFHIIDFEKTGTSQGHSELTNEQMTEFALKFTHDDKSQPWRYIAVSDKGEVNWFLYTTLGSHVSAQGKDWWSTDFEVVDVAHVQPAAAGQTQTYGTLIDPTHYDFPVKFARSDDDYAIDDEHENCNFYATLKLPFAVNMPSDIKVYKLKDDNAAHAEGDVLSLESLKLTNGILPRETPVILEIEKGEETVTTLTRYLRPSVAQPIQATNFSGTLARHTFASSESVYNSVVAHKLFCLGKRNGHVAFYFLNGTTLPSNKAYYIYTGSSSPAKLSFRFPGSEATAIGQAAAQPSAADAAIYDLQGRRVTRPTARGLYIRGGKKYIMK